MRDELRESEGLKSGKPEAAEELPREWRAEIEATARKGMESRVAALVQRALDAFGEGDYARSAELAKEARSMAPRSSRLAELLGLAYYHEERWKEALRELLTFRRMTASLQQNHVIADCYRALGRPDRALEVCGEVSFGDVSPEIWAEVVIVAAGALSDKGQLRDALNRLERADVNPESVEPRHLRLWYAKADLLERAGRKAEAGRMWKRIVQEDPEFFDAAERLRTPSPA